MKVLAISTNNGDPTPYIPAEVARTSELVDAGLFERVLLKADRSGAVLVLDVPDVATARAAVDSLPLVRHGLTRFELTEVVEAPARV
jgi:hypothetical protein